MKLNFRNIVSLFAMAAFCVSAYADGGVNTGYSPYSKFAIGRLGQRGTAYSQEMGGVGVANRNTRYINTLNPAAVTARDSLSFMADVSIISNNSYYRQDSRSSVDNTFNINSIAMSFPIWRSSAFMVGINPFSGLGYQFYEKDTNQDVIGDTGMITDYNIGEGTLYEFYVGAGATFWKRLSVGAQMNVYFGNMSKTAARSFSSSNVASIYDLSTMNISGVTGKFGLQYEQPMGKKHKLIAGATYRLNTKLKGDAYHMNYSSEGSVVDTLGRIDTIKLANVKIPSELSVGLSYKFSDKLHVELDYTWSNWINSGMDSNIGFASKGFTCSNFHSINFGMEYTPNRNDIRYFMRRCTYRVGAYYTEDYYRYNGNKISSAAFTFGMTVPVFRWSNGITFGAEIGKRGSMRNNMVSETFVNFSVGFNIYDIWFVKPKYE